MAFICRFLPSRKDLFWDEPLAFGPTIAARERHRLTQQLQLGYFRMIKKNLQGCLMQGAWFLVACSSGESEMSAITSNPHSCIAPANPQSPKLALVPTNRCQGSLQDVLRLAQYALRGQKSPAPCAQASHTFRRHVTGEQAAGALDRQSWFPNNLDYRTLTDFLARVHFEAKNLPLDAAGGTVVGLPFKVGCSAEVVEAARGGMVLPDTKYLKIVFNHLGDLKTAFPYFPAPTPSAPTGALNTKNHQAF